MVVVLWCVLFVGLVGLVGYDSGGCLLVLWCFVLGDVIWVLFVWGCGVWVLLWMV